MKQPKTVGDQVAEFMEARGLKPADMAAMVKRCGGGNVQRQNIDQLTTNVVGQPRYLKALANAMQTTVDVLLDGRFRPDASLGAPALPEETPERDDPLLDALTVVAEAIEPASRTARLALVPLFTDLVEKPSEVSNIAQTMHHLLGTKSGSGKSEHNVSQAPSPTGADLPTFTPRRHEQRTALRKKTPKR